MNRSIDRVDAQTRRKVLSFITMLNYYVENSILSHNAKGLHKIL